MAPFGIAAVFFGFAAAVRSEAAALLLYYQLDRLLVCLFQTAVSNLELVSCLP